MDSESILLDRSLPVFLDERQSSLNIRITVVPKKILDLQVTDEKDPLFLYTLKVGESDFQTIKREQNLLVDFYAFPTNLKELLERCEISGNFNSTYSPPLQCHMIGNNLAIVEPGRIRNLQHLNLVLKPANDMAQKHHLAQKMKEYKKLSQELGATLEETRHSADQRIMQLEKKLDEAIKAKELLLADMAKSETMLRSQFSGQMTDEREKYLKLSRESQQQLELESKEKEKKLNFQV
jgi:spindle assembly abnormal protein 6